MIHQTHDLLYPPLRKQCQGRPCYTITEAFDLAIMSERCPVCGWFHLLRPRQTPETTIHQKMLTR